MKFSAALPLLFTTLALANPAPITNPRVPGVAHLEAREVSPDPAPVPAEIVARTAGIVLDSRSPKKGSSSGSKNNTQTGAAGTITISRGLQLGALGLGVMEVARLWA
ncbi:hypothetical protein K491DRAFT_710604 [Lophiostoma macrostomum CBS 122681]|uniref:Uncharacterized protein n=1 Tax=Lophiostoma macrostomum CBS 122681 TaxID=1314788 RepID=A0A6A6TNY6_9PLEO|nr:hypothetical protein K491DRAFT_710604 [Lophiostoma macrostomum CBS 122681]